jgi:predicted MPP superfamily phosphohydrolase
MNWIGKGAAGVGLAGGAVLASALYGSRDYRVVCQQVPVLPPGAQRIRVLHLSDEHFVPANTKLAAFVAGLADLEPDLVVSTGDSLASDAGFDAYLNAHARLLTVPGVFVFGSNDYFAPQPKNPLRYLRHRRSGEPHGAPLHWHRLKAAFESAGWVDLTNTARTLRIKDTQVAFVGTDDAHLDLDDYAQAHAALAAAVGTTETRPLTIGVTHAPQLRVLDAMVADGAGIIFAGHTHGGQICLPGGRALTTNCDLPSALASGLHRYPGTWLHVSAGLGTNPYLPLRLNCPPTAYLLELVAVDAATATA